MKKQLLSILAVTTILAGIVVSSAAVAANSTNVAPVDYQKYKDQVIKENQDLAAKKAKDKEAKVFDDQLLEDRHKKLQKAPKSLMSNLALAHGLLKARGVTDEEIKKIGSNWEVVSYLMQTVGLDDRQLKNIINAYSSVVPLDGTGHGQPLYDFYKKYEKYFPTKDKNSATASYSIGTGAQVGFHAQMNYNRVTGFVTLPRTYLPEEAQSRNNAFYAMLNAQYYTPGHNWQHGFDSGVVSKNGVDYYVFFNPGSLYGGWDDASVYSFKKKDFSEVFVQLDIGDQEMIITAFDPRDWTIINGQQLHKPLPLTTSPYGATINYNSDGIGVELIREHSIAYNNAGGNINDGTFMQNQQWSDVRLHSKNGANDQWTAARAYGPKAKEFGDTVDEAARVKLYNYSDYYSDTADIRFEIGDGQYRVLFNNSTTSVNNTFEEYLSFVVPSGGAYNTIETFPGSQSGQDTVIEIYDSNWNYVTSDDDSGTGAYSRIGSWWLNDGTYYLRVRNYNMTNYNLKLGTNIQLQQTSPTPSYPLLSSSSPGSYTGVSSAVFRVVGQGTTASIKTWQDGMPWCDTFLELYADAGLTNFITSNDDGAGNYYSLINYFLVSGQEYYVKVRNYTNGNPIYGKVTITP